MRLVKTGKQFSKIGVATLAAAIAVGVGSYTTAQEPVGPGMSADLQLAQVTPEVGVMTFGVALRTGDVGAVKVRVMGPDGNLVLDQKTEGESMTLDASTLPDGNYRYEMWIYTPEEAAPAGHPEGGTIQMLLERKTDHFQIIGGQLRTFDRDELSPAEDGLGANLQAPPSLLGRLASGVIDFVFTSAHAETNTGSGVAREIWNDTDSGDAFDWFADLDSNDVGFSPGTDVGAGFYMHDDIVDGGASDFRTVFAIGHSLNNTNSFIVDAGGDIGFADNSMFLDRSTDRLGLGTTTPAEQLHLSNFDTPGIRFDDGSAGIWTVQEFGNNLRFDYDGAAPIDGVFSLRTDGTVSGYGLSGSITNPADVSAPFMFNYDSCCSQPDRMFWAHSPGAFDDWGISYADATDRMYWQTSNSDASRFMTVDFAGRVGIGFGNVDPAAPLHVFGSNNTAEILVEETAPNTVQELFFLKNNGHPKFLLQNTNAGFEWEFRTSTSGGNDVFAINRLGSGTSEFFIENGGNARFAGNVTANGVLLTSTREAKTDFEPLDEKEILSKLASLEISEWRYKTESTGTRHIGPVAEEFHEVFGLSDGKTLNMIDTNGITFAAIKALKQENDALRERLTRLEEAMK